MLLRYPDADWALGREDPAPGMVAERYWRPLLTGGEEERVGAGIGSPAEGCCAVKGLRSLLLAPSKVMVLVEDPSIADPPKSFGRL